MRKFLASCSLLFLTQTGCVTTGHVTPEGFQHDALGYSLPMAKPGAKDFISDRWMRDTDFHLHLAATTSIKGRAARIRYESFDLALKHRDTKGVIAVQSFPLSEATADRKLAILAKDYADRLSGAYFHSFGADEPNAKVARRFVTNILSSKAGTLGNAETYEVQVEVADAEQLKLNPQHRLQKYKMLLIRPKAVDGWKESVPGVTVMETYPALIVLTYAMDFAYFDDYVADFDGLVSRLKLRP